MDQRRFSIWLALLGFSCWTGCHRVTSTPPPPPEDRRTRQVTPAPPTTPPLVDPTTAEAPSPSDGPDRVFDETRMVKPHSERSVAETAADALGRIGAAAVPDLIESLHDQDPDVRLLASNVLSRIGPDAVLAVPDLVELLNDDEQQVRLAAIRALGQIGPRAPEAVPALVRLLHEEDDQPPNADPSLRE